MGGFYPDDLDRAFESSEELREQIDEEIDKIETPDFTHKCQSCGNKQEVDDHRRHTPNWCNECETVTTFERLEEKN